MKPFLLTLFLLGALCCYAQDVIKISGSEPVNCKILSANKEEIIFVRNGTQRKVNASFVEYYKYNESVKEAVIDSTRVVQSAPDSMIRHGSAPLGINQAIAGNDLVKAGRHIRSGLTLMLLGSACIAISPLTITVRNVKQEISLGGTTTTYEVPEANYTGMKILMGAGITLNIIGIAQLFVAASDLENAGNKMKHQQRLSLNGSLQGVHIAFRF